MSTPTFAELFSAALDDHGLTVGEVQRALARRGLRVDRTTPYRWRNGASVPSVKMVEVLRYLPRVMGLSAVEEANFLEAAGRALGFEVRRARPRAKAAINLHQRFHYGSHDLPPFAGRAKTLAEVNDWVQGSQPVVITGMGGVGKTRFAQEVLQQSARRFAHGCETMEIDAEQDSLQIVRNVAQLLKVGPEPSAITADNVHQVLAQIQDQLQGVRLLFLLDNVASAEQVRDLVGELTAVTWVLTARRISLKRIGVRAIHLQPPDLQEAADVFRVHLRNVAMPDRYDSELMQAVVDKLGRLPIALRLGASCLTSGKLSTVAELDAWLDGGGLGKPGALFSKLSRLLDHMYAELPEEAQQMLRVCGLFSSPHIRTAHLRSICRYAGIRLSADVWDVLGDYSIVDYPDDDHIELHPLVHTAMRSKLNNRALHAALWPAFKCHFLELAEAYAATDDFHRDYRILIPDEKDLLRVAESFYNDHDWAALKRLWPALSGYLWNVGDYPGYVALDRRCLDAARATGDVDWTAVLLSELGYTLWMQSDLAEADALLREAQAIHDSRPEQLMEQARLRRYRAVMVLEQEQFDQAVELLAEAEIRLAQVDPAVERRLPMAWLVFHSARMTVHNQRGEAAEAEAAGLVTDAYHREIGATSGHTLDGFKVELGDILLQRGKIDAAEAQWQELIQRRSGFQDLSYHADARLRLAWLGAGRGEREAALAFAISALATYVRCGNVTRGHHAEQLIAQIEQNMDPAPFDDLFPA